MTKYLVIDTETTGLLDFKRPAEAEGQPHLAELAMIFIDESLAVEREERHLIKPDGWVMPAHVAEIHGLTTDYLTANGQPVAMALEAYTAAVKAGYVVVAHNAQYDCKIMRAALRRAGMPDLFEETPNICTMRALTGVCRLPQANGKGMKSPKLHEALTHFNIPVADSHTAIGDARSVAKLLRRMVEINVCPAPSVHYAKEGTKAGEALKARGIELQASRRPAPAAPPPRLPLGDAEIAAQEIPK